ncbi:flagellar biosynthesis anti-sigma factor FlgM [Geobacter sp. SVR]|uniref:flagellar biosynthesis anti-sigma factor FlgM n=1 Tax=Geobacter sp. SVR TaxID=2495594 RepID=UPI00143EF796|nr:flagellar biosynthesis anti-sigma factor FlgM [Geobacter sp. SVR]BCS52367.1 hypothetical protein GSVR_06750 [Geobacter sp. SVR]GCF84974.1 hypothetical protein GSbR_15740 [Geobacter sp. SVR]
MKIEAGTINTMLPNEKIHRRGPARTKEDERTAASSDPAFSVTLSKALEQPAAAPAEDDEEIRRARVAAIREQLASGSYNISGKDVASKILNAIKE